MLAAIAAVIPSRLLAFPVLAALRVQPQDLLQLLPRRLRVVEWLPPPAMDERELRRLPYILHEHPVPSGVRGERQRGLVHHYVTAQAVDLVRGADTAYQLDQAVRHPN